MTYRTGGASYHAVGYGAEVVQPMIGEEAAAGEAWYTAGGAPMPVAAYQPIGSASLEDSYVNLAGNATFDAVPVIAPTFDTATGWEFNGAGVNRHLNTGVVPATGWSMIARFSDAVSNCMVGVSSGTRFYLYPVFGANKLYGYSGAVQIAPSLTAGTMAVAANACYADGVAVGATTGSTLPALPIFIGALNNAGSSSGYFTGKIQALAIYDATLTGTHVAAIHAAMVAL